MSFLEVAKRRYTTKKFDDSKKVEASLVDDLQEILRLSPSSINSQPWKFVIVQDEALRFALAEVSMHNISKMKAASHIVVFAVIDDVAAFEKQIEEHLPQGSIDYYRNNIKPLGVEEIKNWWKRQVYLSLGFFLAACGDMGIDSTPMEGISPEQYDEVLGLKGYKTLVAVSVGYRDEEDTNQPQFSPKKRLPLEKVIDFR